MSLDRSLKSANSLVRHRNVLSRAERLGILEEQGKWTDQKGPFGLPKVAHRKVEAVKAVKEEAAEGEAAVAGAAPAAAGAAPAAGAKGAAAPAAKGAGASAPVAKGTAPAAKAPAAKKK